MPAPAAIVPPMVVMETLSNVSVPSFTPGFTVPERYLTVVPVSRSEEPAATLTDIGPLLVPSKPATTNSPAPVFVSGPVPAIAPVSVSELAPDSVPPPLPTEMAFASVPDASVEASVPLLSEMLPDPTPPVSPSDSTPPLDTATAPLMVLLAFSATVPPVTVMPSLIVLAALSVAWPPETLRPPAEAFTTPLDVNNPPDTLRPPAVTTVVDPVVRAPPFTVIPPFVIPSVPLVAREPPLTMTPLATVTLEEIAAAPEADLESVEAVIEPAPEMSRTPVAFVIDIVLGDTAVGTETVAAELNATLSASVKATPLPVPPTSQFVAVVFHEPLGTPGSHVRLKTSAVVTSCSEFPTDVNW